MTCKNILGYVPDHIERLKLVDKFLKASNIHNISYNLAASGYNVAKYVPYGPVKAVIPYLTRRASENSSVAGQMGRELSLIETEIKRRKSSGVKG